MSEGWRARLLFWVDCFNAKHLHEPPDMVSAKRDSVLIAQGIAHAARSVEGPLRVHLIKRTKRRKVLLIHARGVIDAPAGDGEQLRLPGDTDEWMLFFNERNSFAMREGAVIFFSTSQSPARVVR